MTEIEVDALLNALGSSPEEIAASLRARGIQGQRRDPCYCPLGRYLWLGGVPGVAVCSPYAPYLAITWGQDEEIDAPYQVVEFVRRFDEGEWPELETGWSP